jgi:hypothetical protein
MAAAEHLHPKLFHGTDVFLPKGDIVKPSHHMVYGEDVAFATDDFDEAKRYAHSRTRGKEQPQLFSPVYEVEPMDKDEELMSYTNPFISGTHHVSRKGFRIKNTNYTYWND